MQVRRQHLPTKVGPADWFTGQVWMDSLAGPDTDAGIEVLSVHFTPGSRTAWHSHPRGQVLHVVEGAGYVQSRGGEVEHVHAGDTVSTAADEEHWHGAAPGSFMSHLAVQPASPDGRKTAWGDHVTDEEYPAG